MSAYLADFHAQWTAVLALSVFFFCSQWVMPRFGIPASLLLACCAYSSLWVWVWKDNRYVSVNPYDQMALRYFASDSIAKIMLIAVPMMLFSKSRQSMRMLGEFVGSLFVVVNCLLALWQARHGTLIEHGSTLELPGCGGNRCGGLIGNPSISMGFMVCVLPAFVHSWKRQWPIMVLTAVAVYLSQSSIAAGLLAVYACLHLFPKERSGELLARYVGQVSIAVGGVLGAVAFGSSKGLFHDSDRFMIWKYMFDRWRAPMNIGMGTGMGTYHVFSINLQNFKDSSGSIIHQVAGQSWWNTLHNDWLQMLFECGVVGLVLLLLTYVSALAKVVRESDWAIAMSVVLFGLYMTVNPALHNPLPVLFGAWLFIYALRKPTKEYL